ncbi:hypothetical protein [Salinigranum sp. GCM10025319]|uniref:hypothetical protein n=1 Tax=Salinigranum sp. GCM10025319 TaxID=3252687 RepID=UPI00361890EA
MGRQQFYGAVERPSDAAARSVEDDITQIYDSVPAGDQTGGKSVTLGADEARRYTGFSVAYRGGSIPSDPRNVFVQLTFFDGDGDGLATEPRRTVVVNPGLSGTHSFDPAVYVDEYDEISVNIRNNDSNDVELSVDLSYYTEGN